MELTIALTLSILGSVISVTSFALSRKDKAIKDAKEMNMGLIEFRLNELDKNVQKIIDKLDNYDEDIDKKITKAIQHHIAEMHR